MRKLLTLAVVMLLTAVPAAAQNAGVDDQAGTTQSTAPANGSLREGIKNDASQAKQGVKSAALSFKDDIKSGAQEVKQGFKTAWAKVKDAFR